MLADGLVFSPQDYLPVTSAGLVLGFLGAGIQGSASSERERKRENLKETMSLCMIWSWKSHSITSVCQAS